jgi:transcriptional regulator
MYVPDQFRQGDRGAALALIETHPFGLLVAGGQAAHVPFVLDRERDLLQCHVARSNPLADAVFESEVLAAFQGPHAYVSPAWYAASGEVPTWNYLAVQVRGTARPLADQALAAHLEGLVAQSEEAVAPGRPWTLASVAPEKLAAMRRHIVGMEIPLERVDAEWKLSQNRSAADRRGVVAALTALGGENNMAIAAAMGTKKKDHAHDR